jgi:hypothetical protein
MESKAGVFLQSAIKRLLYYKVLADETFARLDEADFYYQPNQESNSLAIIIQHVRGNMLSRWTDFLTTDGEKEWRLRDGEFEIHHFTKTELISIWEKGWVCCLDTLQSLTDEDLLKIVTIRSEPLTVIDAINRQLAHYPYHVGQIVYLSKILLNDKWQTLSIARKK